MPSAVITAAYVNQPAPGRKSGSIKTQDGVYYNVMPAMLGLFQQGGRYEIQYEDSDFRGKIYHMVKSVKPVSADVHPAQQQRTYPGPARGNVIPDKKDEVIFVCGGILRAIQSSQVNATVQSEVINLGINLREAFKAIWAIPAQTPQQDEEMQDSIPF